MGPGSGGRPSPNGAVSTLAIVRGTDDSPNIGGRSARVSSTGTAPPKPMSAMTAS